MSHPREEPQFSTLRSILWPIEKNELKKFLPMGLIMFLILFDYTLLRNTKDALVVTATGSGAEVIPYLKIGDIPCAILFFFIYAKLSNVLSRAKLFYASLIPFLIFFAAFALFIYPYRDFLHPSFESISFLRESYPHLRWIISLYGIWSYGVFYILCELFGVIVISLLFWQFANEITRTNEAKRFYPLFGFLGNISLMIAGTFSEYLAYLTYEIPSGAEALEMSLNYTIASVSLSGIAVIFLYWWMNKYVLTNSIYYDKANSSSKKIEKPKLSISESLSYLFSSPYLGFIAILVISYGVTANIIDVTWKSQIKEYLPTYIEYFAFMGRFSFWTGLITMLFIMLTKGVVRRFGWFIGALITPITFLVTGSLFFSFILFKHEFEISIIALGVTTLYMAVLVGAIQNILAKGMKYSLFDPTKEMAYIPLDQELKVKGKAAVDVVGSRLGKSGGGFIQFILLTITAGSQITILPYLCGILTVVMFLWIGAVGKLATLYKMKIRQDV